MKPLASPQRSLYFRLGSYLANFPSLQMSKIELLRMFLNQRLIAAADEIFGVVEETLARYQEEVSRTREENSRLRLTLDIRTKPDIKLHRQGVFVFSFNMRHDKLSM